MDETIILATLKKMNAWWDTGKLPPELKKEYRRDKFSDVLEYLGLERAVFILGARRTGKTTLMYQLIEYVLEKNKQENIIYVQLDHPNLKGVSLDEIFGIYRRYMKPKDKIYAFLDEIQYLKDSSLWIKAFYDRGENIKFIVSGSAASSIKKDSESLLGRSVTIELYPFSFREFIGFSGEGRKVNRVNINELNLNDFLKIKNETELKFNEYLLRGGFPETFGIKNLSMIQKLLREDILDKAIYKDITTAYDIKQPDVLEAVFTYLAHNSSKILNKDSLLKEIGISKASLSNYLSYLKSAFLVYEAKTYSPNIKKSLRSQSKFYVCDIGLIGSITAFSENIFTDSRKLGELVETIVFNHCFAAAKEKSGQVFYWRDKQKNEVDVIIETENSITPVEVKYRSNISKKDISGLLKFMDIFKIKKGVVVTMDLFKREEMDGKKILFMPAWLFIMQF